MTLLNNRIFSEIEFSKKYFDFIEITLMKDKRINKNKIKKIKNFLGNFPVYGHLDWNIDLSTPKSKDIEKAEKSILIFVLLGSKIVTIHPSYNNKINENELEKNNIISIRHLSNFARKNNIKLLIENSKNPPFNNFQKFYNLVSKIPYVGVTLDIGHINASNNNLNDFLKLKNRIKHIHLHDNIGCFDHVPIKDFNKFKLPKVLFNKKSVTIEIFDKYENKKLIPLKQNERKKILLDQLKELKTLIII
jgi:sugar phosphate isomerase/epimerase